MGYFYGIGDAAGLQTEAEKGVANGYAGLDSQGFVPAAQLAPGPLNAKQHGATGNGTTDDRGAMASATAAAVDVTLPAGTYRVASALTLTANLRFAKGAMLKPDSGVTITINGTIDAGFYQIFDYSAGGKVRTSLARFKQPVHPEWWGADQTGVADSTTAGQYAVDFVTGDAATSTTRIASAPIQWGPGVFLLSGAGINVTSVLGLDWCGAGETLTVFKPSGVMASVLDFNGVANSHIHNFSVWGDGTETITTAIRVRHVSGIGRTTTKVKVSRVAVLANTRYVNGIVIGEPSGTTQCDTVSLHDCTLAGGWTAGETTYWQSGFIIGSNVSANNLDNRGYGLSAARHRYNFDIQASQFALFGFEALAGEIDFRTGATHTSYLHIAGGRSEGSQRLFFQVGASTVAAQTTLSDVDWVADALHTDKRWFQYSNGGTLKLNNIRCYFAGVTDAVLRCSPASGRHLTLVVDGLTEERALTVGGTATGSAIELSADAHLDLRGYNQVDGSQATTAGVFHYTSKAQTYAATNVTTDRSFDANATTLDEVADVLGTLIADLRAQGIVL